MEITGSLYTCPSCGNLYNTGIHSGCPRCGAPGPAASGGGMSKTEPAGAYGGPGATEPAGAYGGLGATEPAGSISGGAYGGLGATEPAGEYGGEYGGNYGDGGFGQTEPVDVNPYRGSGDSGRFQPTIIGNDPGAAEGRAPVVGWLVCVQGPARGMDFRLHSGYNYIGREVGDIRIPGDRQISNVNHAVIGFDDRELLYFFAPSGGRNIVRLNDRPVLNSEILHNYDQIVIGTSRFIFVALCGEHFSWSQE